MNGAVGAWLVDEFGLRVIESRSCVCGDAVGLVGSAVMCSKCGYGATVPLGPRSSLTFGPDDLPLEEYMASAAFAPQSLEELKDELQASPETP